MKFGNILRTRRLMETINILSNQVLNETLFFQQRQSQMPGIGVHFAQSLDAPLIKKVELLRGL